MSIVSKIRFALAVPGGVLVMGAAVGVLESAGHALFPGGPEMAEAIELMRRADPGAREALARAVMSLPFGALAAVVFAWTAGAALGALAACRVAGRMQVPLSIAIAAISVLFVAANLFAMPHPWWVAAAGLVLPPIAAIAVGRLMRPVVPR